jgi:hypothetical protein
MMRHMDPSLVGSSTRSQNSVRREEEVEDTSDGGGHDSEEEVEKEQELK